MDQILLDAAVAAGVEFRAGYSVDAFTSDGNRIRGIESKGRRDEAQLTIGADGRNSRLAQTVQAPSYETAPPLTCWYFSYWSGVPLDGFALYIRNRRAIFVSPRTTT
jgi:flavin-dependent dehydrogenase